MYFWNVQALVQELKDRAVPERDKFYYYLLTVIMILMQPITEDVNIYAKVFRLAITIWGTWSCYQINKSGDNYSFIERMFCLSFTLGFRLMLILLGIGLITVLPFNIFLAETLREGAAESTLNILRFTDNLIYFSFPIIFDFVLYIMLRRNMARVSGSQVTGIL